MAEANLVRASLFQCQVCVPKEFTDLEAEQAAEKLYPCGTEHGWKMDHNERGNLGDDPVRNQCSEYPENVHIMMEC